MNTMLRVLVIVITLLAAAALVFATLNFNKRQILLGRNAALVAQVKQIAKTVEAQDAPKDDNPAELKKDIAKVEDRVLVNPDMEDILADYPSYLEKSNLATLNFDSPDKSDQLLRYYQLDEEGKVRMSSDGQKLTNGPGTMQDLLDLALERAKAQNATLNTTRAQLSKMRDSLSKNVGELNALKEEGRVVKKDLTERKEEIVGLKDDKKRLESNVAKLESDKKELQGDVADRDARIEQLDAEKAAVADELAKKIALVDSLKKQIAERNNTTDVTSGAGDLAIAIGDKGTVVESNDELKFALIEFSPSAMAELIPSKDKKLPQMDMNVRRSGRESASGDFVTRVKLRHVVKGKNLVVADILTDWEQAKVEKGDVVFFN